MYNDYGREKERTNERERERKKEREREREKQRNREKRCVVHHKVVHLIVQ